MARSLASIDAEIAALESQVVQMASNMSSDGVSVTYDMNGIRKRLDQLYMQRGRADGSDPVTSRGVVRGLR